MKLSIASPLVDACRVARAWTDGLSWRIWLRMGAPDAVAEALLEEVR